ncbi:MAG TPA: SdrD B-like domain-containing protein [Methanothrix sp.]|nr:SdrD B-like domain-containing protein [Methanothrix sp.]HQI68900.1 SdrD B-like domain-containing protein [Methanothrix sp.]
MSKCIIFLLLVYAALIALSPASASDSATASHQSGTMQIQGIDASSFPKIKANIFIDKFCALTGRLEPEDFSVMEEGSRQAVDNLYFTGNASGERLDFAVVFDDTGSMSEEIAALKSKVKELTGAIEDSGINASYALVSFKDSVSVKTEWTGDADLFEREVNSLQAGGGGDEPEASLDAIAYVLEMGGRAGSRKIILAITDAHAHYQNDGTSSSMYAEEDIKEGLRQSGAIFILVSPVFESPSNYVDLRRVASDTHGVWMDINSAELSAILERIKGMLTGTYVIEYTSPDRTPGQNRTVQITADRQGCVKGSANGSYISPGSPAVPHPSRKLLELSISGRVFWDSNDNGFMDSHEQGLEGWKVRLLDGPDGYGTTTITDRDGYYSFTGLADGDYSVAAVPQSGWTATNPERETQRVELSRGHVEEIDFGFAALGSDS